MAADREVASVGAVVEVEVDLGGEEEETDVSSVENPGISPGNVPREEGVGGVEGSEAKFVLYQTWRNYIVHIGQYLKL